MKKAFITLVKAPIPGTVKTRLQKDLGRDETLRVYKSFVTEITSRFSRMKGVDRFLGCAPGKDHDFLKEVAGKNGMTTFNQRGNNLAERISNAFRYCAKKGYSDIVLIGSDSPSMPGDFIRKAFVELGKNDFVIGPCFDQGLYLIGARKAKINDIFRAIKLDTGRDVSMILKKTQDMNIRLSMLPFWYDIDNIDDFEFLKLHLRYLNINIPL